MNTGVKENPQSDEGGGGIGMVWLILGGPLSSNHRHCPSGNGVADMRSFVFHTTIFLTLPQHLIAVHGIRNLSFNKADKVVGRQSSLFPQCHCKNS